MFDFPFTFFCVVILLCLSPCCVLSHDYFVYGLSMFDFPFTFFCVVILLCLSPCCVLSHDCFVYGLSMFDFPFTFFLCCYFALFVSLLCLVPRLLCLWIINVWFPLHFFSVLLFCFVCLPAVFCPTFTLSMDYQCLISPSLFFCVVILLCLSPCCVLSHDYFVYGLSMFDFPSLFSVLLFCFVCLPAVSCPTITLSMDYQCLISPSLFSNVYLNVMLSIRFPSIVRCTRCHCVW
jgi:hypothetical protein